MAFSLGVKNSNKKVDEKLPLLYLNYDSHAWKIQVKEKGIKMGSKCDDWKERQDDDC